MKISYLYSAIFVICCQSLVLFGCSSAPVPDPERIARGSLALHAAIDTYGAVKDPEVGSYLLYLGGRLITGLNNAGRDCPGCDITLLDTNEALAYSPGPGHIVLSKGMFRRLKSEAELAFVVAHELAHHVLGHHAAIHSPSESVPDSVRAALEEEADAFAVALLAVSGYDPRFASSALVNAYGKVTPEGASLGYPELYTRQSKIEEEINRAKWRPPGTGNRREFARVQAKLKQEKPRS